MNGRTSLLLLTLLAAPACRTAGVSAPQAAAPQGVAPVSSEATAEAAFQGWLEGHVGRIAPLEQASALAYWNATASGKPEDYEASSKAELELSRVYADKATFEYLKGLRAAGTVKAPLLARQLEVVYLKYLGAQFDPALMEKIVQLSSSIEEKFNTYRAEVDGKTFTDNDVEQVLRTSMDSRERKRVWEASKKIGEVVAPDLIALVKLRNEAARQLGFENYYVMSLALGEQDETGLFKLLDDLAEATAKPFAEVKAGLDAAMAERYGLAPDALRPWHYEDRFFQETPSVGSVDLDPYFKGKDPVELTAQFYDSIGLSARGVIARSDLYGRPGKYQHAYCTDMDRHGDVRVMSSVEANSHWMDTELHEFGHAVYSLGHDGNPALPFLLRDSAHQFTTEGYANMMGRLASNPYWMKRFLGISEAQATALAPQLQARGRMGSLIFAQWAQVMAHFERDLYRNPDQDLNALWWKYVARYQMLTPPEGRNAPDWASKIHLVSSPVYYHNYLLGELYQAQLHEEIRRRFFPDTPRDQVIYADSREVGSFLNDKVFRPGMTWKWDRFVIETTGEPLSIRAYADAYFHADP